MADDADGRGSVEIIDGRAGTVGTLGVRRVLPTRGRRTVGPWCFVDHMGPATVTEERGIDVAPHPHIGLQTVTWLFAGEILHRDSLGTEQVIRPGQLNLMTAGHGVSHSEEGTGRYHGDLHGVQLWVAQPFATREAAPAFEHHAELPRVGLDRSVATVLIGAVDGVASPARRDTDHAGFDLDLRSGATTIPLRPDYEHAVVAFTGGVGIDGRRVEPGRLAVLAPGRHECTLTAAHDARALLIGGVPFDESILMWWNYVARTHDEITTAHRQWLAADPRFGQVASALPRIEAAMPPWAKD